MVLALRTVIKINGINPHVYGQLNFNKGIKIIQGKSLLTSDSGKTRYSHAKKDEPLPYTVYKK